MVLTMASVVSMAAPVKSVVGGKEIALMGDGGLSAKSCVQDVLVAMWDGIENAGWGTHDANATSNLGFIGEVNNIRLYSRALTAEEVAHNYEIDKARFGL
jgi:hypothetical protein